MTRQQEVPTDGQKDCNLSHWESDAYRQFWDELSYRGRDHALSVLWKFWKEGRLEDPACTLRYCVTPGR